MVVAMETSAGDVIRRYRLQAKMSQDDVAVALGKTEGAVSQWETGRTHPRRSVALRLDELLGAEGSISAALGYAMPTLPADGDARTLADVLAAIDRLAETVKANARRLDALESRDAIPGPQRPARSRPATPAPRPKTHS